MTPKALGLDLGSRRIGVALGTGSLAVPYEVIQRCGDRGRDHAAIADLVTETGAEVVVVGLPRSLDGGIGPAARAVLAEVDDLSRALPVPVETYDERLTTVTAQRRLTESGVPAGRRREIVDKVAAAVILQAWLDARRAEPDASTDEGI